MSSVTLFKIDFHILFTGVKFKGQNLATKLIVDLGYKLTQ